jgi:integrase
MTGPRGSARGVVVARAGNWVWRIGEMHGAEESPRLSDARRALERACKMDGRVPHNAVASTFAAFYGAWGNRDLATISTPALEDWVSLSLERGYARGTLHLYLAILHRAMVLCRESGLLPTLPNFPRVRDSDPRQGFASDEQIHAILQFLRHDTKPLVEFLSITGWRYREARDLKWDEIDVHASTIRLERGRTKARRVRTLPYGGCPQIVTLLDELVARRRWVEARIGKAVDYVFVRDYGRRIERINYDWKNACARAGCPGLLVHDLRRSAVRRFERAGIPRSVAMRITGHSTESIYARYAITSDADVSRGMAAAGDAWSLMAHG